MWGAAGKIAAGDPGPTGKGGVRHAEFLRWARYVAPGILPVWNRESCLFLSPLKRAGGEQMFGGGLPAVNDRAKPGFAGRKPPEGGYLGVGLHNHPRKLTKRAKLQSRFSGL